MYSERMEHVSWTHDRGQALQMYLEMLTAPFEVILVDSCMADILEPRCFC